QARVSQIGKYAFWVAAGVFALLAFARRRASSVEPFPAHSTPNSPASSSEAPTTSRLYAITGSALLALISLSALVIMTATALELPDYLSAVLSSEPPAFPELRVYGLPWVNEIALFALMVLVPATFWWWMHRPKTIDSAPVEPSRFRSAVRFTTICAMMIL